MCRAARFGREGVRPMPTAGGALTFWAYEKVVELDELLNEWCLGYSDEITESDSRQQAARGAAVPIDQSYGKPWSIDCLLLNNLSETMNRPTMISIDNVA